MVRRLAIVVGKLAADQFLLLIGWNDRPPISLPSQVVGSGDFFAFGKEGYQLIGFVNVPCWSVI